MKYNIIDFDSLIHAVDTKESAFLCGNGFSINFDNRFLASNLSQRLYETHKHIMAYYSYDIIANSEYKNKLYGNFNNVFKLLNKIKDENDFINFWESAVLFAKDISKSDQIIEWLSDNSRISILRTGHKNIDLVFEIENQAENYGVLNVNYEYWSILIYFVLALLEIPNIIYVLNRDNAFVNAVLAGGINQFNKDSLLKSSKSADILAEASINGMYTYIRLLFTTNILLYGDSVKAVNLKHWKDINIKNTAYFLSKFNHIMTTNYDLILENIINQKVHHLHGKFSKDKCCVLYQSLGVVYDLIRYDFSTTVIGDYFLAKSFYAITADMASRQFRNTEFKSSFRIMEGIIKNSKVETIIIFGLNLNNDYHIIRTIQASMYFSGIESAHIIYCYYNEEDKNGFLESYEKCITYADELNDFVKNKIDVSLIDSKEIINNIF